MTCCWSQAAFTGVWLEWQGNHKDDMNWDHGGMVAGAGGGAGKWGGGEGASVAADSALGTADLGAHGA